jgi:hypothetical protein
VGTVPVPSGNLQFAILFMIVTRKRWRKQQPVLNMEPRTCCLLAND